MNARNFDPMTYKIIGCAMAVHTELGCGFQEVIYQRSLAIELEEAGVEFQREFEMPIKYKRRFVGGRRVDFLVGNLSVELKALTALENVHLAQAMNYLEAYDLQHGLLINFGAPKLEFHHLTNKRWKPK